MRSTLFAMATVAVAGTACAQPYDGLNVNERVFNDFPGSTLNVVNMYPSSLTISESDFGAGGFANRHMAYASQDAGATASSFDYEDGFDFSVTMNLNASPTDGREAGIMTDLFGFGFFGALPNGEIAAFGSFLPFHTFGTVYTNGTDVDLRMIYTPGGGEGVAPASTMEYIIDTGSGAVSSGPIEFTNTELGIPSGFGAKVGVGIQSQGGFGGNVDVAFTNFSIVPAPGAGVLALGGLFAASRRRRA